MPRARRTPARTAPTGRAAPKATADGTALPLSSNALATDFRVCIGLSDALATVLDVCEALPEGQRTDFDVSKGSPEGRRSEFDVHEPLPDALATFPTIVEDNLKPKNYPLTN